MFSNKRGYLLPLLQQHSFKRYILLKIYPALSFIIMMITTLIIIIIPEKCLRACVRCERQISTAPKGVRNFNAWRIGSAAIRVPILTSPPLVYKRWHTPFGGWCKKSCKLYPKHFQMLFKWLNGKNVKRGFFLRWMLCVKIVSMLEIFITSTINF